MLAGIGLLYWMWLHPAIWRMPGLIVPVYIVRTAIMNCNYPLQKSILMDYVSKATRARWNSLESVTAFGWSGSAALGGVLLHRYGYGATFSITATMQVRTLVTAAARQVRSSVADERCLACSMLA